MLFSTLLISAAVGIFADHETRKPRRRTRRRALERLTQSPQAPEQRIIGTVGSSEIVAVEEKNTEAVTRVNKYLRVAGAMGTCIAASTVAPAAMVAVPAIAVFATMPAVRSAKEYWDRNGRPDVYTLGVTRFGMLMLSQSYMSMTVGMVMRWAHGTLYLRTKDQSRRMISEMFGKQSDIAWLVTDTGETSVSLRELKVGDVVVVQAGDLIPVDGKVVSGAARVDQQMLTGEERPVELFPGALAFAGTQLIGGRVYIKAERTGAETTAGRIVSILNQTTEYRLTTEIQAKKIADRSAPYHLMVGALAVPFIGLYRTAGLLLALPTAEVLLFTGPIGMLRTLSRAAEHGIAIMDGRTLEMLPEVDTVVFDKTGTLTHPVPLVDDIVSEAGVGENSLLAWAAAAEHRKTHPVAQGIRGEAERRGLEVPEPEKTDYSPSNGIQARIDAGLILVGSGRYMETMGVALTERAREAAANAQALGRPFVFVARDGTLAGTIVMRTSLRPEAREVVRALQQRGLHVRILSGDGAAQTEAAAQELGVDGWDAEVLPQEKAAVVQNLRDQGRFVCFVGDGINDLVAMRAAQVSVAVAGATTAANAVAGVIIYDGDLKHVVDMLKIGDLFRKRMTESIMVSFIPDSISVATILFAGGGFMTAVVLGWVSVGSSIAMFLRPWPAELQSSGHVVGKSGRAIRSRRQRRALARAKANAAVPLGVKVLEGEILGPSVGPSG